MPKWQPPALSGDQQDRLERLGEASRQVFALLLQADGPLRPYELVFRLQRARGRSTPPSTVYRATGLLIEAGLAHRVPSSGAFVVCKGGCGGGQPAFLICERCGDVDEVAASHSADLIGMSVREKEFAASALSIAVHGVCASCSAVAISKRAKS